MLYFWPFCIAANRESDYALIAAPDFLVRAGELDFFRNRDFRLTAAMEVPTRLHVHFASRTGEYVCAYRAGPSMVDGAAVTDAVGRTLYHAIGALTDDPEVDTEQMVAIYRRSRKALEAVLLRFLGNPAPASPVVATTKLRFGSKPICSAA